MIPIIQVHDELDGDPRAEASSSSSPCWRHPDRWIVEPSANRLSPRDSDRLWLEFIYLRHGWHDASDVSAARIELGVYSQIFPLSSTPAHDIIPFQLVYIHTTYHSHHGI